MAARSSSKAYTEQELQRTVNIDVIGSTIIEQRSYPVPRLILLAFAPGFASIFKNPKIHSMLISDVSYKTFEIFLSWLHVEYYRYKNTNKDPWNGVTEPPRWITSTTVEDHGYGGGSGPLLWHFEANPTVWKHAQVMLDKYFFAKDFEVPLLGEDAIHRLVWCHNMVCDSEMLGSYIPPAAIAEAWKNTKSNDVLRKILVRGWFEFKCDKSNIGKDLAELPLEIFKMLWECVCVVESQGDMIRGCEYHGHANVGDEDDCPSRVEDMCPT